MAWSTDKSRHGGFSLIEVMVAISVLLVITIGSLAANNLTTTTVGINKRRSQANRLAQEGMEALLSARAANFLSLTAGDFHPVLDVNGWNLIAGSEQLGLFARTITLSPVMRDIGCNAPICDIVSGGGRSDGGSFLATVKITWKEVDQDKEYVLNSLVTYWR